MRPQINKALFWARLEPKWGWRLRPGQLGRLNGPKMRKTAGASLRGPVARALDAFQSTEKAGKRRRAEESGGGGGGGRVD